MKVIDSQYDDLLKSNYDLCAIKFSELRDLVKSWYDGEDLKEFDGRAKYDSTYKNDAPYALMKISGLASNYFYAYKEGDKYYLMDGFNRLLTDYAELPDGIDPIVHIKVLTDKLEDSRLMNIMFRLNMWKMAKFGDSDHQFRSGNFLDRGFRLFMNSKFGIQIEGDKNSYTGDMKAIDQYFRNEYLEVSYFNYSLPEIFKLFFNDKMVDDFKQIIKINDYTEESFSHYTTFKEGYIRFLSRRRMEDDMSDHQFETYVAILKEDAKFFKKLQGMSGTDSTRQNVYKFFNKIEKELEDVG